MPNDADESASQSTVRAACGRPAAREADSARRWPCWRRAT